MPTSDERGLLDELITVRDWLRYAVTSMTRANLVYGHGTTNAVDEAAFLLLATLDLPIDNIDPWLDARLTTAERQAIAAVISKRIETRKPAAYLTNTAYIQGRKFYVDDRVIVPRSLIGELLAQDRLAADRSRRAMAVNRVLDLCTGSGCLAILAAEAFPAAEIHASDISDDALAVAERNIRDYRLGDARSHLQGRSLRLGFLRESTISSSRIRRTSPAKAVEAFPPEYRAEPQLAHLGGADGLDLVRRILDSAGSRLTPNGTLIVEVGTGQTALEAARPDLPFLWLDTEASEAEVFALQAGDLKHLETHGFRPAR